MEVNLTCFIGAVLLAFISSALAEKSNTQYEDYRLPRTVRPINYNLTLMIDVEKDTVPGSVEVQILVTAPTSMIVIHANQLTFVKAFLRNFETHEEIEVILDHSNDEFDYWILNDQKNIEPGIYILGIEYMAKYFNDYESYGINKLGFDPNKQYIVASGKGLKARHILPCFDEPALKATFDVTIVHAHRDGYYALSNMDVKDVIEDGNSRITIFKRTPPMSTSNIGFVITDMEFKSVKVYQEGVGEPYELRIYSASRLEYVDLFLDNVKKTLEFFAQYTNIRYPLPKFDLVTIDAFYGFPLTGSLGLVIMNEIFKIPSEEQPLDIYDEIEMMSLLAGLWFGNLVTPSWWSKFWLTSEFSTFMGWKALMAFAPNLTETSEYNAYSLIQTGMWTDNSLDATPLERTIEKIHSKYWLTHPGKGFSILMMAESVIGSKNFKDGVSRYFKKHLYSTVTTSDLIEELHGVYFNMHLMNMVKSFSTYENFPIVTLQKLENGSYILKQKIYEVETFSELQEQRTWEIPVIIETSEQSELIWLTSSEYMIPDLDADWAVISARTFGYYQTNYSTNLWLALANVLQEDVEVLPSLEKINLLRSVDPHISKLNYDIAFEMFRFLEKETNTLVLDEAFGVLEKIKNSLKGDALMGFMKYGQKLIRNYYQSINWTKDTLDNKHYEKVFIFACRFELEDCLVFAETLFKDVNVDRIMSDKNLVIARAGMKKTTDPDVWQKYWEAFDKAPDFYQYSMLMTSQDPELLKKVLEKAASRAKMGDRVYATYTEGGIPVDPELVWSLVRKELAKNEITAEFEAYFEILKLGVDPVIFAVLYGSPEMEEFARRTGTNIRMYDLYKAINSAEKMKPANIWLKENGFLSRVIGD